MFIWTSGRTSSSYRHDEKSVWTEEAQCTLLNVSITETFNCSFSCGPDCWKLSQYPCLQVYVNLTSSGEKLLLYHTEETMKINQKVWLTATSVWTEEAQCTLLNVSITETFNCSFSCGPDCWKLSQYPCLQVYVNLTSSGEKLLLYHTEETMKINQ
ncbi:hypothetical protein A6R68_03665, partial [Neotoma lepida]